MKYFSYKCNICGEAINSDSFTGELCKLVLIKNGEEIESLQGQYNSQGTVFLPGLKESLSWKSLSQESINDLINNDNINDGIVAYHLNCLENVITLPKQLVKSEYDLGEGNDLYDIPDTECAKQIICGHTIVDTKLLLDNRKLDAELKTIIDEAQLKILGYDTSEPENLSKEQLQNEYNIFIEKSKKQLGDEIFDIKQKTEKFVWDQIIATNPKLVANPTFKEDKFGKCMWIHAYILGMFDIFKKG